MADVLAKNGIYFDEVDKIRTLDPEVANHTNVLKDECKIYIEKIDEFQKLIDGFVNLVAKLSAEVQKQKMKTIGTRSILQSMEKQQEIDQQQLQALITDKSLELERLKINLNSLQKLELEQNEILNRLTNS